jgi:formylglycine-generating enzyme required for sulfatase activity
LLEFVCFYYLPDSHPLEKFHHWHDNYQEAPKDGGSWIDEEANDVKITTKNKLLRGGSWYGDPWDCRSAVRSGSHPGLRNDFIGFRVCCLPQDLILYPLTL